MLVVGGLLGAFAARAEPVSSPPPAQGTATPATAPPPNAEQKRQAKRDLADGMRLAKQGDYEGALPKLQGAYAVDPKPSTLRAIADGQQATGRLVESYRSYQTLVFDHGQTLKPKELTAVEGILSDLRARTGTLKLAITEAGANVTVDTRPLAAEDAAQPIRLLPGRHAVAVAKDGSEPFTADVVVEPGKDAVLDVALKPAGAAAISVASGGSAPDGGAAPVVPIVPPPVAPPPVAAAPEPPPAAAPAPVLPPPVEPLPSLPPAAPVAAAPVAPAAPPPPAPPAAAPAPSMPPPVLAAPLSPEPASTAAAPPASGAVESVTASAEPLPPRRERPGGAGLGLMLGLIALPRPIQAEATLKLGHGLAVGAQFSMLPNVVPPGADASLDLRAYAATLRWFPFGGVFYLGAGAGYQQFRGSLGNTVSGGGELRVTADLSGVFIAPQIGWLWVTRSGFAIGIDVGVQVPLPKEPVVATTYNGQPLPDPSSGAVPQDVVDKAHSSEDTVRTLARLAMKYPTPTIDLLRIGYFF
jgi:hypothetical protein